jgi:metal-responsive CopG/Arc/MetJ family transcriptional regulator
LPADLLAAVDQAVQAGHARSRNEFVARALQRELAAQQRAAIDTAFAAMAVAYLRAADNVSGPLASCLRSVNQPVIRTQNAFSALLPSLLADI